MYVVVLTGGLASGKGMVSDMLAHRGATILDLDLLAREVQKQRSIRIKLRGEFGSDVFNATGEIDRKLLAERAFADAESLSRLNAICWPPLQKRLAAYMRAASKERFSAYTCTTSREWSDGNKLLAIEFPLLVEALAEGFEILGFTDEVISVVADEDLRLKRAVMRGMDEEDAKKRIDLQANDVDRIAISNTVFSNNGTVEELKKQVDQWYELRSEEGLF